MHYENRLTQKAIDCWRAMVEPLEPEDPFERIVKMYRLQTLGATIFDHWKNYVEIRKEEMLKESKRDMMYAKVNNWLAGYNRKK